MVRVGSGVDSAALVGRVGRKLFPISVSDAGIFFEEFVPARHDFRAGSHERDVRAGSFSWQDTRRGYSRLKIPRLLRKPFVTAPILCYVTDRRTLAASEGGANAELSRKIFEAIAAGVDWVQIREKDMAAGELLTLAQGAVRAGDGERVPRARKKIIVNDRLDVAIAASASGVHLGRESVPVSEVVQWCRQGNAPREFMIGVSCHGVAEARDAESAGASYVIFGPIFDTPSKRACGEPAGIAQLSVVCAALKIPVLAIGGIDARNARECWRTGAAGIAAIRMFQEARDADELNSRIESLCSDPGIGSKR